MTIRYMFRGGSWYGSSDNCRSAYHGRSTPGLRDGSLGFRVLRSSKEEVKYRVVRGGGWLFDSDSCPSSTNCLGVTPVNRLDYLGFRIIKENKHDD